MRDFDNGFGNEDWQFDSPEFELAYDDVSRPDPQSDKKRLVLLAPNEYLDERAPMPVDSGAQKISAPALVNPAPARPANLTVEPFVSNRQNGVPRSRFANGIFAVPAFANVEMFDTQTLLIFIVVIVLVLQIKTMITLEQLTRERHDERMLDVLASMAHTKNVAV